MSTHPYTELGPEAFWRTAVAERSALDCGSIYRPKWRVEKTTALATAGSCFAQHVGRRLRARGFTVLDKEPAPAGVTAEEAREFGYGVYSARYGNLYSARQLLQLVQEASGARHPPRSVWRRGDRYFDALRPGVEPDGLDSPEEVLQHRAWHLARVREMLGEMELLVFTLGLTETWVRRECGTVYPVAPGVLAGEFCANEHVFVNWSYPQILADLEEVRARVHQLQGSERCRLLLTVSPVPLTATASDQHVLVATTHSKSILRAVAGELARRHADVDYFPAYELITSPRVRGIYYHSNLRTVTPEGVRAVMRAFFEQHDGVPRRDAPDRSPHDIEGRDRPNPRVESADDDTQCEEAMLEAFAP